MGAWQSGDRADRLAALGQVSRSVSVTCAVPDRWSAKILNERGLSLMPRRIGKDAPRGRHRRPARQVSTATAWPAAHGSRPASVRRSAACDSQHLRLSHRAQYRSDALPGGRRLAPDSARSRRFGMPVTPRHSRWLRSARVNRRYVRSQLLGVGRAVPRRSSCSGRRAGSDDSSGRADGGQALACHLLRPAKAGTG